MWWYCAMIASLAVMSGAAVRPVVAQVQSKFPPDSFVNLEVLPRTIPVRELVPLMVSFTRALGVRCTFCHVGEETIPLEKYDFASDEKPAKLKAREMLRMVQAINQQHLAKLEKRSEPPVAVQCMTCHRGVREPRPLQEILLTAYKGTGIDSALGTYRSVRERYYGRAAYDFGEMPLADVATAMLAQGRAADAVRVAELNADLFPQSALVLAGLGDAQVAAGDTTNAIASYERSLVITPENPVARRKLQALRGSGPRAP